MKKDETCYLCGKSISNDQLTRDHFPPKSFHPKPLRKKGVFDNLDWLPAHLECNNNYKSDEEYMVRLMPLFVGDQTPVGKELLNELVRQSRDHPEHSGLISKIFNGIHDEGVGTDGVLPEIIPVEFEREKVDRVIWKITKAAYFKIFEKPLKENSPHKIAYYPPTGSIPPPWFKNLIRLSVGLQTPNPDVFSLKYGGLCHEDVTAHSFVYLLWGSFMIHVLFHKEDCRCKLCVINNGESTS